MTDAERKSWIDAASYQELLRKWRFEPSGSPWLSGELGQYYRDVMFGKRDEIPPDEQVAASKAVGWDA